MDEKTLAALVTQVGEPSMGKFFIEILTIHVKISRMIDRQTLVTLSERLREAPAVVLLKHHVRVGRRRAETRR